MLPILHSGSSSFLCRGGACHARLPLRLPRSRALSSSSSSELSALRVSALYFSFPPLPLPQFPFSDFHFPFHRIAPFPRPEYPLSSRGGLGCASVWQGSGSSLESSSQLFVALRRTRSSSTKNSIPKCAGAASARSAAAAPWPFPESRTSPTFSTWPPSTAASGRPPISGTPGIRSSTISPPAPSARSPLHH